MTGSESEVRAAKAAAMREWRAKNPERAKATRALSQGRTAIRRRALVSDYKTAVGCADCGYSAAPEALDFDHRPGTKKLGNPSEMWGHRIEVWLAEIEKCDVICSNCHRIRTAERSRESSGTYTPEVSRNLSVEDALLRIKEGWTL